MVRRLLLIALGGILATVAITAWQLVSATHEGTKTGTIVAGAACSPTNAIGDGCAARAGSLDEPFAVTIDRFYNVYVADKDHQRIRKITPGWDEVVNGHFDEIITTVAGTGTAGFSGDGGPATSAQLDTPENVFVHKATGNIYIADSENHRVRMVNSAGIIDTVAGNGSVATGPCPSGPATSAPLGEVEAVHVDNAGNLYIANSIESGGITLSFICKVDTSGNISNIAGKICTASDPFGDGGPAVDACLREVEGLTRDRFGNIYFSDNIRFPSFPRADLRKIDSLGIVTKVASGFNLLGLEADRLGRVFVADYLYRVMMYDPATGTFTNVAGTSTPVPGCPFPDSFPPVIDHIPGDPAANILCWARPYDVAVDLSGDVFVTDTEDGAQVWRVESLAAPCPDLNQDGLVNIADIAQVTPHFGDTPFVDGNSDGVEGWTARRDISRNHVIDQADIDALIAAFGTNCWY